VVHDIVRVQLQSDRVYLRDIFGETWEIPYPCGVKTVDVATQRIGLQVSGATNPTAVAAVAAAAT
jgi:predicted RNA-binding protein